MMTSTYHEVRQRLDQGFTSFRQLSVILICFLLNIADGFDVIAIAMTAPSIAKEWGVSSSLLGLVLSAEMVGMTIGALYLSSLSDKFGRRPVILGSVSLVSAAMLLTAFCSTVPQLVILRLVTGIGIGGVLVAAVSLSSEYSPDNRRHAVTIGMSAFFSLGTILAGPLIQRVLQVSDWQNVFLIGGFFGCFLTFIAIFFLPESLEYLSNQDDKSPSQGEARLNKMNAILGQLKHAPLTALRPNKASKSVKAGSVRELLNKTYRVQTIQLWIVFFILYWIGYFLLKWMPKLLVNLDFDLNMAITALTIYMIGGVVGSAVVAFLSTRYDSKTIGKIALFLMGCLLLAFAMIKPASITHIYMWLFVISMMGTGGVNAMIALSTTCYPSQLRASGYGYCIGIGRAGGILSPIVAGVFVQNGWGLYGLYLLLAMPAAFLAAALIHRLRMVED